MKLIRKRWGRRDGEALQIGDAKITVRITGRGRGRRIILLTETPATLPVGMIPRQPATKADTTPSQS